MSVHRANLVQVINDAWERAREGAKEEDNKRVQNANRSEKWMRELAGGFASEYRDEARHRIFWRGSEANQKHFRRNEYLFDLMVCSVSETESLQRQSNRLEFIDQCHWQVESEFHRGDSREVIVDMSKLVLGSGQNKLFIAAHRNSNVEGLKRMCGAIASRCSGNVYLGFVCHPAEWVAEPKEPSVFEWLAGDWEAIPA